MGLEQFTSSDDENSEDEKSSDSVTLDDIEVPEALWRYFLSRCKGHVPVHCTSKLEDEEIQAILDFIDKELSTSRPFAWDKNDDRIENMKKSKKKLEEYLEKR